MLEILLVKMNSFLSFISCLKYEKILKGVLSKPERERNYKCCSNGHVTIGLLQRKIHVAYINGRRSVTVLQQAQSKFQWGCKQPAIYTLQIKKIVNDEVTSMKLYWKL